MTKFQWVIGVDGDSYALVGLTDERELYSVTFRPAEFSRANETVGYWADDQRLRFSWIHAAEFLNEIQCIREHAKEQL